MTNIPKKEPTAIQYIKCCVTDLLLDGVESTEIDADALHDWDFDKAVSLLMSET